MKVERPLEVLIVDDNPGDAALIIVLLEDLGLPIHISIAENGEKALDILDKVNGPSCPAPDFVVLDLNLPKVNGFDVLELMKSTPRLSSIPVVVMTGSLNKEDEIRSRRMGVTDYWIKPSSERDFDSTCRWLRKYLAPLASSGKK